ncbi:hypothetical protein C1645_740500 [Glomus cerebriforme]|uniref:Uncharacterized protein n=1 Tax=Glomus cerebriforme TaxID=658196 RepID=A0A397SSH9_9GLOM|nr:hypothetical protein C1645_740500 [Glomus cerebriforme]
MVKKDKEIDWVKFLLLKMGDCVIKQMCSKLKINNEKWKRDKSLIARNVQSNKCKARIQTKRSNTVKSVPVKHKQNMQSNNNKKKNKKTIVIDTDVKEDYCENDNYEEDNHNKENELALRLKELEYWEKI